MRRGKTPSDAEEGAAAANREVLDADALALGGDHHAVAGIDGHVAGPPDDVAGLGLGGRDDGAGGADALGGVGKGGAELAVDIGDPGG